MSWCPLYPFVYYDSVLTDPSGSSPGIKAAITLSRRRLKHALWVASALSVVIGVLARADELVVSAASLTNVFKAVSDAFEQRRSSTKVLLNFGASDVLMQQIVKGAPADVFASADQKAMDKAAAEKVIVPARTARRISSCS